MIAHSARSTRLQARTEFELRQKRREGEGGTACSKKLQP